MAAEALLSLAQQFGGDVPSPPMEIENLGEDSFCKENENFLKNEGAFTPLQMTVHVGCQVRTGCQIKYRYTA